MQVFMSHKTLIMLYMHSILQESLKIPQVNVKT